MQRYYSGNRRRAKSSGGQNRFWMVSTVVLFAAFVVSLFMLSKEPPQEPSAASSTNVNQSAVQTENANAGTDTENSDTSNDVVSNANKSVPLVAYISIIIDDLGNQSPTASPTKDLLSLNAPVAFSVIPERAKSHEVSAAAKTAGYEVIIHQPMEPVNPDISAGAGAILSAMSSQQAVEIIDKHIAELPEAIGMNNHMGSKITQDADLMRPMITALKNKGLFFVDSMTISTSKGFSVAKEEGVKTAKRGAFIDGQDDESYIRNQLLHLANEALEKRIVTPIGIGHIRPKTVAVLQEMIPELARMGVGIKPISQVVE